MTTNVSDASNGTSSPSSQTAEQTPKKPQASARAKAADSADLSGFVEKLRAKTESAKLADLKPRLSKRAKDLVTAMDAGITATDIAADLIESAPFFKDIPKNVVAAAIEEIVKKERDKASKG